MNFRLAREIYGEPWAVDSLTAHTYSALLNSLNQKQITESNEDKLNSMYVHVGSELKLITDVNQLDGLGDFNGVGILNFDGPITLNGGFSTRGVLEQRDLMLRMAKDTRIKSFGIIANSGGGSTAAVEIMARTITKVRNEFKKDVKSWTPEGGVCASAMYGIVSACSSIHAEHDMSRFGSCGTMISFSGRKSGEKNENGGIEYRVYASKSEKKNQEIEQALNSNNITILQDELLNPINERFLNLIETNRPILKNTDYLDGHTEFASNTIGKFIDSICDFDNFIVSLTSKSEDIPQKTKKLKSMNLETLKSEHPEVFKEVLAAGVKQENERVNSWLAWKDIDSESVFKGIESGESITASVREKMQVKAITNNRVEALVTDSTTDIKTKEVESQEQAPGAENKEDKEDPISDLLEFYKN